MSPASRKLIGVCCGCALLAAAAATAVGCGGSKAARRAPHSTAPGQQASKAAAQTGASTAGSRAKSQGPATASVRAAREALNRAEERRDWNAVVDAASAVLAADPSSADARLARAEALARLGRWTDAAKDLAQIADPQTETGRRALETWCRVAISRHDVTEPLERLRAWAEELVSSPGENDVDSEKPSGESKAGAAPSPASVTPDDTAARRAVTRWWLWLELEAGLPPAKLIALARRVLVGDETDVGAMLAMARAQARLGKRAHALYILERALELAPHDADLLLFAARLAHQEDDDTSAVRYAKQAADAAPHAPGTLLATGLLYDALGDHEGAVDLLRRAVDEAPGLVAAWLALGAAQRAAGQREAAEKTWRHVTEMAPDLPDGWYDLGLLVLDVPPEGQEGVAKLEQAAKWFERAAAALDGPARAQAEALRDKALKYAQVRRQEIEQLKQLDEGDEGDEDGGDEGGDAGEEQGAAPSPQGDAGEDSNGSGAPSVTPPAQDAPTPDAPEGGGE